MQSPLTAIPSQNPVSPVSRLLLPFRHPGHPQILLTLYHPQQVLFCHLCRPKTCPPHLHRAFPRSSRPESLPSEHHRKFALFMTLSSFSKLLVYILFFSYLSGRSLWAGLVFYFCYSPALYLAVTLLGTQ